MRSLYTNKRKKDHVAISIKWDDKLDLSQIWRLIKLQTEKDITIFSIQVKAISEEKLKELLTYYLKEQYLDENKIKVSFIGKWYDLPEEVLRLIKERMTNTKEYTNYFLNFVVNYDGHQEIVDATKILCRQIIGEKIDIENITSEQIKENLYTSYFIPPELIIAINTQNKLDGFLLWDSYYSEIVFIKLEEYNIDLVNERI